MDKAGPGGEFWGNFAPNFAPRVGPGPRGDPKGDKGNILNFGDFCSLFWGFFLFLGRIFCSFFGGVFASFFEDFLLFFGSFLPFVSLLGIPRAVTKAPRPTRHRKMGKKLNFPPKKSQLSPDFYPWSDSKPKKKSELNPRRGWGATEKKAILQKFAKNWNYFLEICAEIPGDFSWVGVKQR